MPNKDVFIRMKVQEQGVIVTVSLALNAELYGLLYLWLLGRIMNEEWKSHITAKISFLVYIELR